MMMGWWWWWWWWPDSSLGPLAVIPESYHEEAVEDVRQQVGGQGDDDVVAVGVSG